jgi:uncharacterized protein with PQ loop repeat
MKKLKTYETFINEEIDFRKGMAAVGLMGALAASPVAAQTKTPTSMSVQSEQGIDVYKNQIEEISTIRKEKSKDVKLSIILDEIKSNINSKDSAKFIELYTKLTSHIESEYDYKIPEQKVEELTEAGIAGMVKNMTIFEIMGWLGSICLAVCGIPQAWQSYKDKNSDGISWGFVILWAFGEVFALAYVYDKLDLPLLLNYATNILILGVILYYKVKPQNKLEL